MRNTSAVKFATNRRIHIGLAVHNLARSIDYYRILFGQATTKTKPGYAKFEVAEPPVNLSLNESGGTTGPMNLIAHFGIQVQSTEAVQQLAAVLAHEGLATITEENVTCCYAVQDKVWVEDPDGNKWEAFVVLDNDAAQHHGGSSPCCDPNECCVGAK